MNSSVRANATSYIRPSYYAERGVRNFYDRFDEANIGMRMGFGEMAHHLDKSKIVDNSLGTIGVGFQYRQICWPGIKNQKPSLWNMFPYMYFEGYCHRKRLVNGLTWRTIGTSRT